VLERKVAVGQVLQPADPAFVIADLSNVWLVADIPEQNAGELHRGQKVEAEISALPGTKITGTLALVGATVDRQTRTVRVRMNLANRGSHFKPGMLATMSIGDGVRSERVIPIGAIVHEDNKSFVFAAKGDDRFNLMPVELGPETARGRVLLGGLPEGQQIVLDGAFHLNNERKRLLLEASN
jgi:cobalt-zinc-cadmium efflux system membrane fusion protein